MALSFTEWSQIPFWNKENLSRSSWKLWIECFQFCITGQAAGAVLWWRWIPPHTKGLLFFVEWLLSSVDVKVWTQFSDKPHAAFLLAVRLFAIRVSGALGASFLRSEMMVYLQQKKKAARAYFWAASGVYTSGLRYISYLERSVGDT